MDDTDRKILRLVQRDTRLTAEAIGQDVGLSPAAPQKRLQRMRASALIAGEIAVLDPEKLGRSLTIITHVTLERETRAHLDAFKRQMRSAPCVQQCYYATGEADFILILIVQDMTEYEAFTQQHFFEDTNVSRFTTSVVMDRVKVSLDVL
jgi:DNA-binding Lrp family transcriptional regulator